MFTSQIIIWPQKYDITGKARGAGLDGRSLKISEGCRTSR